MDTDVLVVGGGLGGAAAALRLAGSARVTLIERERAPVHKVCGEFLSVEALAYLRQLGLAPERMAEQWGAVPLDTVRLMRSHDAVQTALPFPALSVTRRVLDRELLQMAQDGGVEVRRGCAVQQLVRCGTGWKATLAGGDTLRAGAVFLAAGKHDVRGHARPPGKQNGLVAFKMYWRLQPEQRRLLAGAVELVLYRGGYAGLQPVEGGLVNLCCLVQAAELRRMGGWTGLLAHMLQQSPHLQRRLRSAEPVLGKPLTVASLPYGFVRASSQGLWYVGDQAVVIPSFTGDGMSLALHTGLLAAAMFLQGESAAAYQTRVASQVRSQVALATAVSRALVRVPALSMSVVRLWPGVLRRLARQTRIRLNERLL